MSWLFELATTNPVAHAVGVLSLVCVAGLALGGVKIRGIGLGVAGVLFAGIATAHFGEPIDKRTLDFVRDFGLILFVFMIGLQLGPGFVVTLKEQGLTMNALALVIVLLGAVTAVLSARLAGFDPAAMLGIFSGGSVNMPSLGAATDALAARPGLSADRLALPALACAVTFPAAIVASIGVLLVIGKVFRVDPKREAAEYAAKARARVPPVERRAIVVTNDELNGLPVDAVRSRVGSDVTISRVRHAGEARTATGTTPIRAQDVIAVVGTRDALDGFERVVGSRVDGDLAHADTQVTVRSAVVTAREVLGKSIDELALDDRFDAVVTRVTRTGIEMSAIPGLRLQFGDTVTIVGHAEDIDKASAVLGNEIGELNETQFVPLFLGIAVGVFVGTLPIPLPGLPQPLRLGLAGGPLIVALALGRLGHIRRLVYHIPNSVNLAFRDFGLALFFAAVGLNTGANFFSTVFSVIGLKWLLAGVAVAVVPMLLVGIAARTIWRMNFMDLSGLLAGSTTNPPALAFVVNISESDAPTAAYATVYPLAMVLRVLSAQVLAVTLVK